MQTKRRTEVPIASDNSRRNYAWATRPLEPRRYHERAKFADLISESAAFYNARGGRGFDPVAPEPEWRPSDSHDDAGVIQPPVRGVAS